LKETYTRAFILLLYRIGGTGCRNPVRAVDSEVRRGAADAKISVNFIRITAIQIK
jgi:hypothetical protein